MGVYPTEDKALEQESFVKLISVQSPLEKTTDIRDP
jgi:hypothetical protein